MKYSRWLLWHVPLWTTIAVLLCSPVFADDPPDPPGDRPLSEFLTENGTFQNPDGYSGSLNPAGFSLAVDEDGTPVFMNSSSNSNDNWTLQSALSGTDGSVGAIAIFGDDLYIGGVFSHVGGFDINIVARYDMVNKTWHSLGDGVTDQSYRINDFAIVDNDLYVGGRFETAGEVNAKNIARYDMVTQTWHSLGNVIQSGEVRALTVVGDDLYLAGGFDTTIGANGDSILRFNMVTESWHTLGDGIGGASPLLFDVIVVGDNLFVGGSFINVEGSNGHRIARFNIEEESWHALGDGVNDYVWSLASDGNDLYVGGRFTSAGGMNANHIARFNINTESWYTLGDGLDGSVFDIIFSVNQLYVGGEFTRAGETDANNIARYDLDSESWHSLGDGIDGDIRKIILVDTDLYVGGLFRKADDKTANNIAYYDLNEDNGNSSWRVLKTGGVTTGFDRNVTALAASENYLYVGGSFSATIGGINADHIARYNLSTRKWEALGDGVNDFIHTIFIHENDVYVGGGFTNAGGVPANYIARYNLSTKSWHSLGQGVNGFVIDLTVYKDNLIVGGGFDRAGEVTAEHIARYSLSTETWHALTGGGVRTSNKNDYDDEDYSLPEFVGALLVVDNNLYVGGAFDYAGEVMSPLIVRYNLENETWYPFKNGFEGVYPKTKVADIVHQNEVLYIAGNFSDVGDLPVNNIVKYNLTDETWHNLGDGLSYFHVNSLLLIGKFLFTAGRFTTAGGISAEHIARYDIENENWSALGDGVNNEVFTLTIAGNNLYVGGNFLTAGNKPASYLARWSGVPAIPDKLIHFIPENNSQDVELRPKLDWQHDEVADSYELIVSESDDFSDPVIHEVALDPSSHQINEDLDYNTTYNWKVRGSNENGSGPWSDSWSFTTASGPVPDQVTLQSPEDTQADIPLQPTLTWEPADEAEEYRLELSDTPDFSDPMIHQEDIEATSFQITENLQYGQTYYWRVRGVNTFGKGPWSDSRSFTTVNSPVPEKVILLSPENNSNKIQLRPELAWNQADESNSYELLLSENQDLSNPFLHQTDLQETSFQLAQDLDYNKIYYWRVRGGNDSGDGPWSDTWNFTTVALPDHVTLKSPENNALDIPLQPELSWMAADETESYELEISESSDLSNPFLHPTNISGTSFQITDDLDYDKTYFWHVRGINSNGNGPWSETWIFSTIPPPMPAQVVLVSPGNNGTNIPLQPELTWEAADETESYELILSEEPDLSMPLLYMTDLQETIFQVDEDLQYNQTYYWQVRGTNMYGEGSWSEVWSFTTIAPSELALDHNWPNPFSKTTSGTTIRYRIPVESKVRMEIYNLSGKRVAVLVDQVMTAGQHDITFNGSGLADGLYFYRLVTGDKSITRKMMLIN